MEEIDCKGGVNLTNRKGVALERNSRKKRRKDIVLRVPLHEVQIPIGGGGGNIPSLGLFPQKIGLL